MTDRLFDYDAETNQFVLDVSPRETVRAKQVPGMRYHKQTETWRAPALLSVAITMRGVFGTDITVTDAAKDAVKAEATKNRLALAVKDGAASTVVDGLPDGLFDFQVPAADVMSLQQTFVNMDEKGNGKTVEALAALEASGDYPAIVIATNSMKHKWAEEVSKWTTATPVVAGRTPTQRLKAISAVRELAAAGTPAVLIMGWAQILKHSKLAPYGSVARTDEEKEDKELNGGWLRTVIADEAHYAKDPKSKRTRALWAIGHGPSVVNRWPLTATPWANNTLDLWSIFHFAMPDRFPSRSQFRDRYVLTYTNHWGGVEDLGLNPATEAEFRKIVEPFYIRRPLQIDVSMLPTEYRMLDMEPKQEKAYRTFEKNMILAAERADGSPDMLIATNPLTLNTYLQTLAAATPVLNEEGRITELQAPSCKVDALLDLVSEMGGEPLVVFAESRKLIELCARTLTGGKNPVVPADRLGLVTGQVSDRDRFTAVERFQAGELPVILLTLGAGSEGITLTRANTAVYLNRSYKMVANNQADGRLFRTGQKRDVQLIELVTRGTVEERVHEATGGKEELLQQFVQDPDYTRKVLGR